MAERNQCSSAGQQLNTWEAVATGSGLQDQPLLHETLSEKQTKTNNKTLRQIL